MCLIAWSWRQHPDYPLVVLANRDEAHARPSSPAHWWEHAEPPILAGRDLEAGGTWLGLTSAGHFAALTNRPGPQPVGAQAPSRGGLTVQCLSPPATTAQVREELQPVALDYAGFNLLFGDGQSLAFLSNREPARTLGPGVHAMANGALDEPIPKVERLAGRLRDWTESGSDAPFDAWMEALTDARPLEGGLAHSAVFVKGEQYGTRASAIVAVGADGHVHFMERTYAAGGVPGDITHVEFEVAA